MAARKPSFRWIVAIAVLLLFVIVMIVLDRTMTLDTLEHWVLRIGFVLLGLIAAGSLLWYLRPADAEPVLDPSDDLLMTLGAARARLPHKSFGARHVVLVLGPEGAARTTLVARSGGNPESLAGDGAPGPTEAPTPTSKVNVWALQNGVFVEPTAKLLSDASRFSKVVRALRAPRIAAARGDSAARSAIVCVPCDLFYAGDGGKQLESLATTMRQRLAEASRDLGLALPVYVMFTKLDRVPNFTEWVGVFTKDELRAPLGATLPFDAASTAATFSERLGARLDTALETIWQRIAARRVDLLSRENVQERRYASYELARQLRKLTPALRPFLTELCRPTQLGSSPQLRGFYFTGVRPVIVNDAPQQAAPARAQASAAAADATQLFHRGATAPAPVAASASASARKIPEWTFLDQFLRDVVLADTSAAAVAGGGARVHGTRRALLGAVIAACFLAFAGSTISWLGNRALARRVDDAARAVAALPVIQAPPGTIAFPSAEALRRLEALRAQLDTVGQLEKDGPPLRLRFGLWQGEGILSAARPVWFDGFRKQLFATSWGALVDSLKSLPDAPTASNDYGLTYGWLKGYLITTSAPERSTSQFLAPVLLTSWQRGQTTDADATELARKQFAYYADVLPENNPFPAAADASLVTHAREFLARFTGGEQIYRNMIAAADKAVPAVKVPQAPGVLTTTPEVAGSFSAKGAAFMSDAFRNSDKYFQGETWVVGDATAAKSVDRVAVINAIKAKYTDDYVKAWRQVLQATRVASPSSVRDAADKLDNLSGTQSPILQVLRTAAVNTNSDSVVRAAFQPVHAVTPPEVTDKFVSEKNQPYMEGLLGLAGALRQVANLPPATDTASALALAQAAQAAGGDVTKARVAEKKVAQAFTLTPAAGPTASAVETMLNAPISGAEAVLRTAASTRPPAKRVIAAAPAPAPSGGGGGGGPNLSAILNERGRALCSQATPILAKFPFNPDAQAEATIAEVTALLGPGGGALWAFREERLAPFLEKQGGKYVAKPVGNVALSATFVEFFNRAAQVSQALFPDNAPTPTLRWMARGITSDQTPMIMLKHGGREAKFDSKTPRNEVVWPAESGREAKLEAQFKKNKPVTVASATGEWALFRLVAQAAKFDGVGHAEWSATGKDAVPVVVEFDAPSGLPVLKRGWLGGMTCVAQVTQ